MRDKTNVTVSRDMLEGNPLGLHLVDCVSVEIEKDVPAEMIQERLRIEDCVTVSCLPGQRSSVEMVSQDVVEISTGQKRLEEDQEQDTCYINTAYYKM